MSIKHWVAVALMTVMTIPIAAQASTFILDIKGQDVSGRLILSYEIDTNTAAVLNSSPNTHDPLGAYIITDVTGTFSDVSSGIKNASITGLEGLNEVSPESTNLLAPSRFSLLLVANGVDDGSGHPSPGLHYDNIFYRGGSPQTASDYPFKSGFFDIYGVVFTLDNGDAVNFWSNGIQPRVGLNYGASVTDRTDVLSYTSGISVAAVPEPAIWLIMAVGFGTVGAAMRRRNKPAYSHA